MFSRKSSPFFIAILIALTSLSLSAQEQPNPQAVPGHRYLKEYWDHSELYLEHQAWYMLDLADKALNANPPSRTINPERQMAEMRKFQAENDFNPLGGCLPMLTWRGGWNS